MAKKKTGTALVSMKELEKMYAAEAVEQAEAEPSQGAPVISTRGKKFTFNETSIKSPLRVVIVAQALTYDYYDSDYDPEVKTAPACYAIGDVGKESEMKPRDNSPKKQSESCGTCPQNQFGSAEKGRGKACRNSRRLVVMMADDRREDPQLAILSIAPTGLGLFSKYVKQVTNVIARPLHGVITDFTLSEDSDWPVAVPSFVEKIDDPGLASAAMRARKAALKDLLYQDKNTSNYSVAKEPASKKKKKKSKFK